MSLTLASVPIGERDRASLEHELQDLPEAALQPILGAIMEKPVLAVRFLKLFAKKKKAVVERNEALWHEALADEIALLREC